MRRLWSIVTFVVTLLASTFSLGLPANAASTFNPTSIVTNTAGTTVTVSYAVALDTASGGTSAEFTLMVAGTAYSSANLTRAITGSTVVLTLTGARISNGQAVTLAYARANNQTKILQAGSANYAANFAATSVSNNVPLPDTAAPTIVNATTNTLGSSITLTFNEPLLTSSVPAPSDFALVAGSAVYPIANYSVGVSGATVILTLTGPAITYGQIITLDYVGGTSKIKDLALNNAANFSSRSVTNAVVDSTPPSQISRQTNFEGTQLIATFNETLDQTSVPTNTDIQIFLDGSAYTNFSVAIDGARVVMNLLGTAVQHEQVVTLNYTPGLVGNRVKDLAGNQIGAVTGADYLNIVPDTAAPGVVQKSTNTTGTSITLVFNEPLLSTSVPSASDFVLTVAGEVYPSSSISVAISEATVLMTLTGAAIQPAQLVTLSYTPGANAIFDRHSNQAASFTNQLVANIVSDNTAPLTVSRATNASGDALSITFDEPLNLAIVPSASDFVISRNGATYTGGFSVLLTDSLVQLTLTSPNVFVASDVILVSYIPGTNKLQDPSGNLVAAMSSAPVSNNVQNVSAPSLTSVTTNTAGNVVSLNYAVTLDSNSTPAANNFTLKIDGVTYASNLLTVSVVDSSVLLTLSSAVILYESVLTLTYSGTAIKGLVNGISATPFTDLLVTNNVADTTPPHQIFRGTDTTGYQLITSYDELLDETSVPQPADYQIYVDGNLAAIDRIEISGIDSIKFLVNPIRYGQVIFLNYTPNANVNNRILDLAGNAVGAVSNQVVQNLVPDLVAPLVTSRITNNLGNEVRLMMSEGLATNSVPASGDFVLRIAGAVYSSSNYTVSISGNDIVLLVLSGTPIDFGQNVTLSYVGGVNKIQDTSGNVLPNFTNQLVSNLVTDASTPLVATFATNSLGTKIILGYNEALDSGYVPDPMSFEVFVGGIKLTLSQYTVAITGQTVELTLINGALVTANALITLSYTPATNRIRDLAGNYAVAIVNQAVNNTVPDTTGPTISISSTIRVVRGITLVGVALANEVSVWTIRNDAASLFSINAMSGEIFVSSTAPLGTYVLEITATDAELNSTDKVLQIIVFTSDYPVIDAPAEVSIVQGAVSVARPTTTDEQVTWGVVLNASGYFAINSATGQITASGSAAAGIYSFVYSATDDAGFVSEGWMIITISAPASSSGSDAVSSPPPISEPNSPVSAKLTGETTAEIRAALNVAGTMKTVIFSVPERGTPAGTNVYLLPGMSEADENAGHLVVEIKAFNSRGIALHQFSKTMSLNLGQAKSGLVAAHSNDGLVWTAVPLLKTTELAAGQIDGYYIDSSGSAIVLTRHLSFFGFKQPVSNFKFFADKTSLSIGQTLSLNVIESRSGAKATIKTLTPNICPLIGSKKILAYQTGVCQLVALKASTETQVSAISQIIKIKVVARKPSLKK